MEKDNQFQVPKKKWRNRMWIVQVSARERALSYLLVKSRNQFGEQPANFHQNFKRMDLLIPSPLKLGCAHIPEEG